MCVYRLIMQISSLALFLVPRHRHMFSYLDDVDSKSFLTDRKKWPVA
jgi:hypothetical protein